MDRLTRIAIHNLACFGELSLTPGASSLLIGGNGAGKSTLFNILFGLRALVHPGPKLDALLPDYQVSEGDALITLDLATRQGPLRYELTLTHKPAGFRDLSLGPLGLDWAVRSEVLSDETEDLTQFSGGVFRSPHMDIAGADGGAIPLVDDRSPLSSVRFRTDSPVERFKAWLDGVWLLRLEPRRMAAAAEEPADSLDVSGENFVAWLMGFRRSRGSLERIVASIGSSVGDLRQLSFARAGREHVLVAHFASGASVDFDRLSDGQRCLIVLHAVLVLARRFCRLLLLDEPDAHVTSTEILPLFSALREQVERAGIQVMVASHHPQVIDILAAESPWELIPAQGRVTARPFRVDLTRGISASRHLLLREHP